ncbi:DUF4129 domain-containing protein [Deinococcus sp. SDU3-2]|uniref:DUF4129 domain-containing protein n=1 Tax=Deinococcus terrestris TaxID=2651870 RepID=A0A7X1TRA0_9DEIO|nr:DUF4129 domain-containing protein [Deinococcus terrestris]MPY66189.1 DUF4129 domain-containing protein [Deinococcus terrestris]
MTPQLARHAVQTRPAAGPEARSWLLLAAPLVGLAAWPLWAVAGAVGIVGLARPWAWLRGMRLLALLLLGLLGELPSWVWVDTPDGAMAWQVADARLQAVQDSLPLLLGLGVLHVALWALEGGTRRLGAALLLGLLLWSALFGAGEPWALVWGALGLLLAVAGAPDQEGRALQVLAGRGQALRRLTLAALGLGVVFAVLSLPLPTQSDRNARIGGLPAWAVNGLSALVLGHYEAWKRAGCGDDAPGCSVSPRVIQAGQQRDAPVAWSKDAPAAEPPTPRRTVPEAPPPLSRRSGMILAVALTCALALVTGLGWLIWRWWRSPLRTGRSLAAAEALDTVLADSSHPHRVRQAYRSALASLTRVGLGRAPEETPAEHAARVSEALPDLANPLRQLLAVYAPVRYGLSPSEEGAEQAEAAARTVARLARPRSAPDAAGPALG